MGYGIAADSSGNAYVTGITSSTNFPTMNPIQATNSGVLGDVFVTKLNSQGSALVYSTYLGGVNSEVGSSIAVDSANNAYVAGSSSSSDFPVVAGALRTKSWMYKSIDGAKSWSNDNYGLTGAGPTTSPFISNINTGLAIDPIQTSTIYMGTAAGVYKSVDSGRSWSAMNNGLTSQIVVSLVVDPSSPSTLYVANVGTGNGVYKSTDGGASWNLRRTGISGSEFFSLAIDPVTPNTLYVGVNNQIYKSTDGATSWVLLSNVPSGVPNVVAIDPLNHSTIYALSFSGGSIIKSSDAGATWQSLGSAVSSAYSIAVSPLVSGTVYAAGSQGLFKSTDGGNNWSQIFSKTGRIFCDPVSASTLYLLSNPHDPIPEGPLKSIDGGQTWSSVITGLETHVAVTLAIDPLRPSTLFLASLPTSSFDAFALKINPAGNALVYSTLLGGPPAQSFSLTGASAYGIALDALGNAYVAGLVATPSFQVTPDSYQPFIRGGNDGFVTKLGMSFSIGGKVLDGATPVSGAEIVLTDGLTLTTVLTESDGSYLFTRLREGGSFTVSASKSHFTITPPSQNFPSLNSNQVLNFTATATNAPFHTISGQITDNGAGLVGVTVTLSGSQAGIRTTDSNGNYSFEVAAGGNYIVTPSVVGFSFGPANQTFNNLSGNQTANFAAARQNFVVTNAKNHGAGSLREAITNANASPGPDTIVFNIPGAGVKTITILVALPDITDQVVIDATTQPGYAGSPLIELDGLALGNFGAGGLVIRAGGSTVRGLSIGNFRGSGGIALNGCDNNTIQSNYLGVAANGTTAFPNARGIILTNSSNNMIGGTTASARNVISGNGNGIDISGNSNVIQGNYIGTNATGTAALLQPGGVTINGASFTNNLIGGTAPGAGNLISGNSFGVSTSGTGTTIQGNLIGTDVTGTNRIPNTTLGVGAGGVNITVGGLTAGARNIISGNLDGVAIRGAGSKLQGNYIGTDITGTLALGNNNNGVVATDTALVGGTVPEARNIISASGNANVSLSSNNPGSAAMVQGNYIGTDVTGTRSLGSPALSGIAVSTNSNIIGGLVAGARNVISGNRVGIQINFSVSGNVIQGNFIGVNAAGTGPLPNTQHGISILGSSNNTIGGTQSEASNKIAFNGGTGVLVSNGSGNVIRSNSIFSNGGLGIDLGADGVTANDSTDGDTGANQLQNFPVISGIMSTANSTTIQGSLKSTPATTFQIDFYSNAAVDPSGNGEGARYLDSISIATNGNGDATINTTLPISLDTGRVITATATDPNGNTSEFSAADSTSTVGSVQFSVSSIQVIEDIGSITVTVLRTGGASGDLTVGYSTVDGTAIAGQDYTSTSGSLTFASGETSKTLQIPILDDTVTEPDEKFTIELSNPSNLESLGSPSILNIVVQDHSTTPVLTIPSVAVFEGSAGSTTDASFTISLSAATGRSVTGNYASSNFSAFGGASCSNQGVDYETTSGTFAFNPGATTFTIPVKICGDNNAEANETFRVILSNVIGATPPGSPAVGFIVNDDVLELGLEESGPVANQAAALDAILSLRDPFRVGIPDWFPTGPDRNTRIALFAHNLQLNPGELSSAVIVRFIDSNNQIIDVPAEDVRSTPNSDLTQVVVRLPNNLPVGTCSVFIRAHTLISNSGFIRIAP